MSAVKTVAYAVTLYRERQDVYREWRKWDNLPTYSRYLKRVEDLGDSKTRWTAEGPNGDVSWEAETTIDIPNEKIGWKSLADSKVEHAGVIEFKDAPGDRGTEVKVTFAWEPPYGIFGDLVSKATGMSPEAEIADALRTFKAVLECGEAPVIEGQPSNQMRKENMPGDLHAKVGLR